jgi:hypothetical protein
MTSGPKDASTPALLSEYPEVGRNPPLTSH